MKRLLRLGAKVAELTANEDGSLTARGFWLVNAEVGYQAERFRKALPEEVRRFLQYLLR